jgi:uridylate kinase
LQGDGLFGIDPSKLAKVSVEIANVVKLGVQVALVIGGGNLIRGAELYTTGFDRVTADQMGMMATIINGLALRDALEKKSVSVKVMSALGVAGLVDSCDRHKAKNADPIKNPKAQRYSELTYDEVLEQRLGVMDLNAILLCRDNRLPLRVFNMNKQDALARIVMGDDVGTLIKASSNELA